MRDRGDAAGRPARTGREKPVFRPNPRRQFLYVALTLAALFGGYWVGTLLKDADNEGRASVAGAAPGAAPKSPRAWYRSQSPPPALVTAPDAPLFPEPNGTPAKAPVRPYEEALPHDIYEPPAPASPPAAAPGEPATLRPWRRFAAVAPPARGRPMIALVIDDMGVDRKRSARVVGFPAPLTLSFLAYADDLGEQTAAAAAAGHELLLHVPMEPANARLDPGPNVLLSGLGADELRRRLRWDLSRFSAYVGINNHMGSKFTADRAAMTVVLAELRRRGLLFLDSRTTGKTVGAALARRMGVPFAERNIFLDNVNDVAAVNSRLAEVERFARRNGFAVAIGHPRDATLAALASWLQGVEARGFVLVPLTAVVNLHRPTG